MKHELYIAVISGCQNSKNGFCCSYTPVAFTAFNKNEATGKALEMAKSCYPESSGFYNHQTSIWHSREMINEWTRPLSDETKDAFLNLLDTIQSVIDRVESDQGECKEIVL